MESAKEFTTEIVIQYSIVGLILLVALGWILWKMLRNNKKGALGSCCGCAMADSCKKIEFKDHGNTQNLQRKHCGESNTTSGDDS